MLSATTPSALNAAAESGSRAKRAIAPTSRCSMIKRIAGEGHQSFACRPLSVADAGICRDRIGQMGLPLLRDQADLEFSDPHT